MRLGYDSRVERARNKGHRETARTACSTPPRVAAEQRFQGPGSAMLTGVYVPAPGCWEITGEYHGNKSSFVVWVEPLQINRAVIPVDARDFNWLQTGYRQYVAWGTAI